VVSYYVEARNSATLISVLPAGAPGSLSSYTVGASVILMNEIFARGTTGNADWIEIYNASNSPVDISNFKIYDSGGNAGTKPKMAFASGTIIAAKGYYVITVDDAATANPTGSSFGLSSSGEQVWFENADGAVIETFTFGTTADATQSYGRLPDGSANWQVLTTITKGTANQ
jgi:hypothetical protein